MPPHPPMTLSLLAFYVVAGLLAFVLIWWAWIAPIPEGMWESKTRDARGNLVIPFIMLIVFAAVLVPRLLF